MTGCSEVIQSHFHRLVNEAKSPFFIYFQDRLEDNLNFFTKYFEDSFDKEGMIFSFSLKTQPNYKVVNFFKAKGFHFDVSSHSELDYALRMGISPERISLEGVGVNNQALDLAISHQIGSIHFDNIESLQYYLRHKKNCQSKITLRYQLDSQQSKIGFTKEELTSFSLVSLDGLHVYLGRETFSIEKMKSCLLEAQSLFQQLKCFREDPILYLGPGVPDLSLFKEKLVRQEFKFPYEVRIEAGRALCSSAGFYAASVLSVKTTISGQKLITIDGGLQHLGSPWVTLKSGPMNFQPFFLTAAGAVMSSQQNMETLVYGSLCLWHDCLHPRLKVPAEVKRGDWIIVPNMGAYGRSLCLSVKIFP